MRTGNPASVPKAKPCGILLVDFKREILREWLGKEKNLSFEAQYTKIKKIPILLVGRKKKSYIFRLVTPLVPLESN